MKDININLEGFNFEEKVLLKIYYYLSLPASETTRSALILSLIHISEPTRPY